MSIFVDNDENPLGFISFFSIYSLFFIFILVGIMFSRDDKEALPIKNSKEVKKELPIQNFGPVTLKQCSSGF